MNLVSLAVLASQSCRGATPPAGLACYLRPPRPPSAYDAYDTPDACAFSACDPKPDTLSAPRRERVCKEVLALGMQVTCA